MSTRRSPLVAPDRVRVIVDLEGWDAKVYARLQRDFGFADGALVRMMLSYGLHHADQVLTLYVRQVLAEPDHD